MSHANGRTSMPITFEARERMRDQQRLEAIRLEAVLAAQRRLAAERERADRAIAKAEQGLADKQVDVDQAVVGLVEASGLSRTALLLGCAEADLARLVRAERRRSTSRGSSDATTPGVPA